VRVFPWRWTAKKGWDDTAGESGIIKPYWFYDWGSGRSSSLNAEYVPMKWGGGGSFSSFNTKQKSTHALGFNEPDKSDQANISVADALAQWPDLMQSGLRLGAPAVSDSATTGTGLDWLYDFMNQADARGYRVDYIPIHFYKCGWSANQLSNYLAGIWQTTGRPIWVTEFNYGANWCADTPTPAQEANVIGQFLDVLENSPFVERYSIFNWVGTNRAMVLDNGTLTPAGLIYRDRKTAMAYTQTPPPGGIRRLAQFHFENDTLDSSGCGNNGFMAGIPDYAEGKNGQSIALNGTNDFIQLPENLAHGASFSFAAWVYWNGGGNWQRIFDFGNDTAHYLFLTPSSSAGTLRFAIRNGGGEQIVETTGLPARKWQHVAVTVSGNSAKLYTNGVLAASSTAITIAPSDFSPKKNYLGESQFPADPLFSGKMDEVQIADYAMTAAQIAALQTNQPPRFLTNYFDFGTAAPEQIFTANLGGTTTDPDFGDTLTFSKISGPAWLNVSANGTLSGTPGLNDGGTNFFTVRIADSAGAGDFAEVAIYVPIVYASGIWITNADGNWDDTNNWSGGQIANGAGLDADFSALNITSDRTVTLGSPRNIGSLEFGDTSGAQSWTILSESGNALTLDAGSSAAPSIVVNQNTAEIAASLAGKNGFAKTGAGALVLSGANSLSGTIYIDRNSSSANDGILRAANPDSLLNVTNIQIRNNNSGFSTLQLDGANGIVTIHAALNVSCRNNGVATIENLSGTNFLDGPIWLNVGGNGINIQSDAGLLVLGSASQYIGSLTGGRNFVFSGAGDHLVNGPILASPNDAPIGLIKSGAGVLTLAGANSYTNNTTVSGGTLLVNGSTATSPINVSSSATLGGKGLIQGPVTIQFGGTLAPGANAFSVGSLSVNNSVALQSGSFTRMKLS
jgi:autotransporter-associated beta strand protein